LDIFTQAILALRTNLILKNLFSIF